MSFSDPALAAEIRDTISSIADDRIQKLRPAEAYASIQTIDVLQGKATVTYPGETTAVPVSMGRFQPVSAGAVVRIAGASGDRYIQDVVNGAVVVNTTELYVHRSGVVSGRLTQEGGTGSNDWVLEPNGNDYTLNSSIGQTLRFKTTPTAIQAMNGVSNANLSLNPAGGSILFGTVDVTKVPLGRVNFNTLASNSTTLTGTRAMLLAVTATLLANRKIRVTVHTNLQSGTANVGAGVGVANGAGTLLNEAYRVCNSANAAEQVTCIYETTTGAGGSTTFQLSAFAGTAGTVFLVASATILTYITIDDMGAV